MPTFDERWAPLSDLLPDVGEPLVPSGGVFSHGTGFAPVTNVATGLARDIPRGINWLRSKTPTTWQEARDDAVAIAKAIGQSVAHDVTTPGKLMQPNPHPPGSELWYKYEDLRSQAAIEWAPMMALNTLGAGLPFAKKGAAGMFGGDLAQTADQIAFAEAKRMQAAGASPAEIRAATGLDMFPDKKLRFEIDDSAAKLTPRGEAAVASEWGGVGTMADYFEHPELYRAYPQFRDVPVSIEPPAQRGVQGSFFHGGQPPGDISAADITVSTGAKDPRSVFLHEGSHLIQHLQDFAPGSTTSMASLRPGTASWDLYQQIRANLTRPTPIEQMPPGVLSDTYTYADYVKEYKAAMASPEKRAQLDRMAQEAAVREAYRRSAGEGEANIAVTRRDYTPEQRRVIPPEASSAVPFDRQIVDTRHMLNPQQSELRQLADDAAAASPRAARAKAALPQGRYPQYAEAYPPIGPPELMSKLPDPKNPGKFLAKADKPVPYATMEEALARDAEPGFFLEKKLTPEVEQFQKDRIALLKEMDRTGYTPYFDPAKRFDVDASKYGPFADTAIEASPKKAATVEQWNTKYGSPEARERLQAGFEQGKTVPDSDRWYLMGQLEAEYIKELGPEAGREAFRREFADMMAATTGGASPFNNFLMSHYANVVTKRGERLPERSYELPFPIGGRYAAGNIAQAQKYVDEGKAAFDPAVNPKRYDFSSAYLGNKNAATIDEQMMQAIDPGVNIPQWYGPATRTAREEAAKAGVDPRGFQDVGWAGLKKLKTGDKFDYEGPMINHINRSIEITHRLTGMPREEIVRRGLVLKQIPMYGLAGAVGAAPLMDLADRYGNHQ